MTANHLSLGPKRAPFRLCHTPQGLVRIHRDCFSATRSESLNGRVSLKWRSCGETFERECRHAHTANTLHEAVAWADGCAPDHLWAIVGKAGVGFCVHTTLRRSGEAATDSAFGEHLKAAFEHLCAAQQRYPEGKDVFTISGYVERAKHDCREAARLAGVLPNRLSPDTQTLNTQEHAVT